MKNSHAIADILVVDDDPAVQRMMRRICQNHAKALDAGTNDFLPKNAKPEEILAKVRSHLKVKQLNYQLRDYRTSLEKTVSLETAQLEDASLEIRNPLISFSIEYCESKSHIQSPNI